MPATLHVLHAGYVDERGVGATVSLVLDGAARIVVDPGMVADREQVVPGHGPPFRVAGASVS
ncbi:MAG: hypothetical protein AABM41_00735 [Chloroflexota bacterium]